MFNSKTAKRAAALFLVSGMLLTGCSGSVSHMPDDSVAGALGISSVSVKSHTPEKISGSEYGDQYSVKDTVSVSYSAPILDGLLKQSVSKDMEFYMDKNSQAWDLKKETLTATALPGSCWKCEYLSSEKIITLFGDKAPSGGSGVVYVRFLKKMGLFSFNLSNAKNTSTERFFETVGTNVKLVFTGTSGNVEGKASVTGGSVSDTGDLFMDLETDTGSVNLHFGKDIVSITEREYDEATGNETAASKVYMDNLPVFELTTTSLNKDGEWKTECGLKEGNVSPALSWKPVDGATKYAVVMIDITTTRWLYWFKVVDKTELSEGAFTDPKVYTGPYPAGTHTYEIHVIALKGDPKECNFQVDARGGDIQYYFDYVNTAADGSVGNVIAYGTIKAPYTSPELYYGYR